MSPLAGQLSSGDVQPVEGFDGDVPHLIGGEIGALDA
jgi:hypothetical protein